MARLEIEGKVVEVDDSFLKLSKEQQQDTVDEIARSFTTQDPKQPEEASGMLKTFLEAAAQSASFDQYDSMKAWKNDTTEEKVQQQLNRDWEANPWSGRAGWLAGMIGGGGLIGAGAKAGAKLGAKAIGKGAQYANATEKAAKWAKANPKKAIGLKTAGAGAAYDTTYRALNDQEVTPGTVATSATMGGVLGRLGGTLGKKQPKIKHKKLADDVYDELRDVTRRGVATRADLGELVKFMEGSISKATKGTTAASKKQGMIDEVNEIIGNLGPKDTMSLKEVSKEIKQRFSKQFDNLSATDKKFKIDVNDKLSKLINKRNKEYQAKHSKLPEAKRPEYNQSLSADSVRKTFGKVKDKLRKADTSEKRRKLLENSKFTDQLDIVRKVSPEFNKEVDKFLRGGPARKLVEMISKVGAFGMGTMLAHAVASPGTLGLQLGGILAAKTLAPKMQSKRYRSVEDKLSIDALPEGPYREKLRSAFENEKYKNANKGSLLGGYVGGNLSSGLFSDGEY